MRNRNRGGKINYYELYLLAPWHKKSNLEYFYNECGYSLREIGKIYKCDHRTIHTWMIKFDIERRGFGATYSRFNNRMYRNRFYLIQQYVTLGLSTLQIAKKEGVHKTMIARWLAKFNIPRKPPGGYKKKVI